MSRLMKNQEHLAVYLGNKVSKYVLVNLPFNEPFPDTYLLLFFFFQSIYWKEKNNSKVYKKKKVINKYVYYKVNNIT